MARGGSERERVVKNVISGGEFPRQIAAFFVALPVGCGGRIARHGRVCDVSCWKCGCDASARAIDVVGGGGRAPAWAILSHFSSLAGHSRSGGAPPVRWQSDRITESWCIIQFRSSR